MSTVSIDCLSLLATGRETSLFLPDIEAQSARLREKIQGSRVLVIGGAGSIGSATIRALLPFRPNSLHVVDQSENNLAELVRDLRSGGDLEVPGDFRALPLDYGTPVMKRLLQETGPYDLILNFAALKHVRSEKDIFSLVQMLDTNVMKQVRFLRWLEETGYAGRYFCISTDKAANPVNLMGASKRIMEHLLFSGAVIEGRGMTITSARFANVAFSDASLLDSFLKRLQKRQPLSAPSQTKRYFVSLEEAGQICLLAAVLAPDRHLLVPRLDPASDLHDLETIAAGVLRYHNLEPQVYKEEESARSGLSSDLASGRYPLLVTPLDTSGEKPYEEFIGEDESGVEIGLDNLLAVTYAPAPQGSLPPFLTNIERLVSGADAQAEKAAVIAWIASVVPAFQHIETGRHLDQRM